MSDTFLHGSYCIPTAQNTAKAMAAVHTACVGRPSCKVQANWGLLGDPCPGRIKTLAVEVTCGDAKRAGAGVGGSSLLHGFAPRDAAADIVVDCRGLAARDALADLRGVRGEMVVVRSPDVSLQRPVRMLHPHLPLYIVPRGVGLFMIGATMIESERRGSVSVRSAMELLNAAYALHPAFGEAEIVELGADLRPAFPDNLPQVRAIGRVVHANGLFRHGFLLAPTLARRTADAVQSLLQSESTHADLPQRRRA